jgi:membrane protein DedA with SNARE-associated domain
VFSFRFFLLGHGYWLIFAYVAAVELGLPLPADPMLLIMGAMVGNHRYGFIPSLLTAVSAALIGDLFWYSLGRLKGRSVLGLLCRLSLEPDTCVRKTESSFTKRGPAVLLIAKFVPGISILSIALAGVTKMPRSKFLALDVAGCVLWASSYLVLGRIFYRQVDDVIMWLGLFGRRATMVVLILIALYIGVKYAQRWWFRRNLRINRVSPEQVRDWLAAGEPITIVDLRHPAEIDTDGLKIPGALILRPDEIRSRSGEIPRDQEIILYCS